MLDNTQKFSGKAAIYASSRPRYAQDFIDLLGKLGISKGKKVADIGSGTGILSAQLLTLGAEVYGVEPNDEMRHFAEDALANNPCFHSVAAAAEATTLDSHCVNFITVGQAFHWFDEALFKIECRRILKSADDMVVLVWNHPRSTGNALEQDMKELYESFFPNKGEKSSQKEVEMRITGFFSGCEIKKFNNDNHYDKMQFIKRMLSTSAALTPADARYEEYVQALQKIADTHAVDGVITLPVDTVAYVGKI